jgi:hypothetical protein
MASLPLGQVNAPRVAPDLVGCVRDQGSASHPYPSSDDLLRGPAASRNLADAIHFLCALHGRQPGVIELVASRTVEPSARDWLNEAAEAFARERALLARLAVEAGPVPATPGPGSEAVIAMQRNALITLAQSERRGCAIGAALAVSADWFVVRTVLDAACQRFGVEAPLNAFRSPSAIADVVASLADQMPVRRAVMFGAEQVALQHRGLWDLLQARAQARTA